MSAVLLVYDNINNLINKSFDAAEESENQYNCMIHRLEIMNICTKFHGNHQ